ncbi:MULTISPECIES: hypothetical protein [Clostridium]|uniref:DUF5673 domain-containing protein n=1 Tax=Clostridium cibarium TaxID=2762247 RepID=A0ABR8PTL8_9CLOT|nr:MULTISPECIES: hypothetical protein [Clostridium]MBD7911455.1 hypothetical protein [Clostridium cibarium]
MDNSYFWTILNIILIIFGTGLLLKDLYAVYHHGKFIVKVKDNRVLAIIWGVLIILFSMIFSSEIRLYIHNKLDNFNGIFVYIFWIELSISNIIKSFIGSELRENGIYNLGYFYKWDKIKSYSWVLPDIIQFKANTFLGINRRFKFDIDEELKPIINETIERKLGL